jgi:hypothetical protein
MSGVFRPAWVIVKSMMRYRYVGLESAGRSIPRSGNGDYPSRERRFAPEGAFLDSRLRGNDGNSQAFDSKILRPGTRQSSIRIRGVSRRRIWRGANIARSAWRLLFSPFMTRGAKFAAPPRPA